ncbi:ribonuclease H-like domain-containing protein [Candidatus Pacearchaeota archaeon]|nr:ribonuclease H-like domain-containing protein [Candidatus Pacearchaeota archaeon]
MKTKFIPIDYDYFDLNGKNHIKIIGRDETGKRICVIDTCDIYMWAILNRDVSNDKIEELKEKISKITVEKKDRTTVIEKIELHDKKFLEKEVKALKIFATNYKDLPGIASELGDEAIYKRRGYDLGFTTHYIIEKKLKPLYWYEIEGQDITDSEEFKTKNLNVDKTIKVEKIKEIKEIKFTPKVLSYDIETDALQIGEGEILMISLVSKNYKKVISWKKSKTRTPDFVEYVEDEKELLKRFVEEVKKNSPDFLVGYFSDGFDLPYIKERARLLNVRLPIGIDGSQPRLSRGNQTTAKINGIVHIDILRFIKTAYAQYMKSESLSLNEVAKEFLNDKKIKFELKHSSKIDEKNWNEYYKYNLQDSVLVEGLFEKMWPDLVEFSKTINEPIFDTSRYGLSKYIESYILHNLEKFNEIPERRPGYNESNERKNTRGVEGAFVLEPKPGLYDNIAMFDFTSMHTSIIITHNLSSATLLEKKEKDAFVSPEIETKEGIKKYYFQKKIGFFPELLKDIFEKRKKFKEEYKKNPNHMTKARSNAFKVLSASAHGYIGFFGARYYSKETSASVLAFVRKFNQEIIEKVEKEGFTPIFGDTDSVGFLMNNHTEKEVKDFLKKLNSELPGVMHLELEGFFKRGLWVTTRDGTTGAKKKYAMIDKKGKTKIRGFETVRRDWCRLSREMQSKVIKLILEQGNGEEALAYVKEVIKKVKTRKIEKEDIVIKTQLKKPIEEYKAITPHVIAAKKMAENETPVTQGGIIEYFIAETRTKSKLVRDKVALIDEDKDYEIKYYLEKQIIPAIENIFQVLDIDAKSLITDSKQTTLF